MPVSKCPVVVLDLVVLRQVVLVVQLEVDVKQLLIPWVSPG